MLRLLAVAAVCAVLGTQPAAAQNKPVTIVNLVELSGDGATAGTNFKNGLELAFKEINASGGILGRKIESVLSTPRPIPASPRRWRKKQSTWKPMR